ncbi:hypothetical protein CQW23_01717 [Capsicum baccatum]|uniref:XS domain-containing protein n=1 Tax=Capsicum baccatum TaxID=33114 RepID=A0A2G2XPE3_CAPBA|nr:hypothetical protein CQW23_01717 [Capsicum baccatum]
MGDASMADVGATLEKHEPARSGYFLMRVLSFLVYAKLDFGCTGSGSFVLFASLLKPSIGFPSGKAKALYSRDGHLGVTLVKFTSDQLGFMKATWVAEYFEKENHRRNDWVRLQPLTLGKDDKNKNLPFQVGS